MKPAVLAMLGVFLASLLVHAAARDGEFVFFDDGRFVTRNPHIDEVGNPLRFFLDPQTTADPESETRDIYRPIRTLSYAIIASGSGKDEAAPFHALAIFLHALTAVVLVALIRAAGLQMFPSVVAALVWSLHPLTVEVTAWVCSLGDAWCGLFVALSVLGWAKDRAWLAWACLVLALFSKEHAVVLPGLWLAWDFFLRRDRLRKTVLAGALPGLAVVVGFLAFRASLGLEMSQLEEPVGIGTMIASMGWYAATIVWPFQPTFQARVEPSTGGIVLGLLVIAALVAGLWRGSKHTKLGCAWFLLALVPVSNIVVPLKIPTADRFLYIPLMGLALLPAQACVRWGRQAAWGSIPTLFLLSLLTHQRIGDWKDSPSLVAAGVRVTPKSHMLVWQEAAEKAQRALKAMQAGNNAAAGQLVREAHQEYRRYIVNAGGRDLVKPYMELGELFLEWGKAMQREDHMREYISAYSTSLEAFATAFKLQQTGHRSTRSDRERAADLGSQVALLLAIPDNRNLHETIQVGIEMLGYLEKEFGRNVSLRGSQLMLVSASQQRVKQPEKAREALQKILATLNREKVEANFLRGQAHLYLGIIKPYSREHLETALRLFLKARKESRDQLLSATFYAARAACAIAKVFDDPDMERQGKALLASIEPLAKQSRIRLSGYLERQIVGEKRTCAAGRR